MAEAKARVTVGQFLAQAEEYSAGPGTIQLGSRIVSTLVGLRRVSGEKSASSKPILSVLHPRSGSSDGTTAVSTNNILPEVNCIVLARVTRITRLQATLQILIVNEIPLHESLQGIIRTQDVRATEMDKVRIDTSFRPGDIVRAQVISLGDGQSYFLSTAKNELGVLFAWDETGEAMFPASWKEMRSEKGVVEERKVAKPFV